MIKYFRSNFPLILSIENHCSIEQQDRMAKHLVTILGDLLHTKGIKGDEKELPSPMDLQRKILVKAKRLSECGTGNDNDNQSESDDEHDDSKKKRTKANLKNNVTKE
jgi:hypothetical protein